jgi:hypothetical protein
LRARHLDQLQAAQATIDRKPAVVASVATTAAEAAEGAKPLSLLLQGKLLVILIGLPRSGKSTWAREYAMRQPMSAIVCPDSVRLG